MAKTIDVLKNKNFFLLWVGQIISQFGDRLNQMALIALVYTRFPGSPIALAKLLSFTIIPAFVIGPIAGACVDRWDRKKTMIFCDISRAFFVGLIPLVFISGETFYPIYATVFLIFAISCFFIPSKLSIIPDLVTADNLLMANSLTTMTALIAVVLGLGVGGPLVEAVGAKGGFLIDSVTYLISAIMIAGIKINKTPLAAGTVGLHEMLKIEQSIFKDIKDGVRYALSHKDVRSVLMTLFVLMSAAGALYVVSIVFIQQSLQSVTKHFGILAIFLGIGFFSGAVLYGKAGKQVSKYVVMQTGLVFTGIFIAIFSIFMQKSPNIWVAGSMITLIGMGTGPIVISANTLVHEVIDEKMRGRTFSSLGIVMNLGFLIFMFLASTLAEKVGQFYILLGTGVILAAYGALGFYSLRNNSSL